MGGVSVSESTAKDLLRNLLEDSIPDEDLRDKIRFHSMSALSILDEEIEDAALILGLYDGDYGADHPNPKARCDDKAKIAFHFGIIMHLCSRTDPVTNCTNDIVNGIHLCGVRIDEGIYSEFNFIVIGCAGQNPRNHLNRLAGYLSSTKPQKVPIPDPKRYQDPSRLVIIAVDNTCAPPELIPIGNEGSLAIGLDSHDIITQLQNNPSGFTKWMKARIGMEMV